METAPETARVPLKEAQVATLVTQMYDALNAWRVMERPGCIVSMVATPPEGLAVHFIASDAAAHALRLDVCRLYSEAATALVEDGRSVVTPPESMLKFLGQQDEPDAPAPAPVPPDPVPPRPIASEALS